MSKDRDFKGIWISKEIWLNPDLLPLEKLFLAEIDSLDNDEERGCFASNEYFGLFFRITTGSAANIISSLKKRGYVFKVFFDGRNRGLRVNPKVKAGFMPDESRLHVGMKADLTNELKQRSRTNEHNNKEYNKEYNKEEEKGASLFSSPSETSTLEAEKEKTPPPIAPAPPLIPPFAHVGDIEPQAATVVRLYDHELPQVTLVEPAPSPDYARPTRADAYGVNIREEVEAMKTDGAALETFCLIRKLPRDKFAEYLESFALDVLGRKEKYPNAAKLRSHCFSWCEIHHRKTQEATANPINSKATIRHFGGEETDYTQKQVF